MTPSDETGLSGLRVVSFESRRAEEMRRLIHRFGGEPLVAPSMREVPLEDQREVWQFAQRLFAGTVDVLVLLTGVGTRTLVQVLTAQHPRDGIVRALAKLTLVARGPKPVSALAELQLRPHITVPEPNTWQDILAALDAKLPQRNLRIAVQEYGVTNHALLDGLAKRSAEVIRVPIYRWALPEDLGPLRQAVRAVCEGWADVLLVTSANQLHHVMQVATDMGLAEQWLASAARCVIASVGPISSEAIQELGLTVDVRPPHPNMVSLLTAAGRGSRQILQQKRAAGGL